MKKDNVDLKIRKAMVDMSEDVQPSDDMFERIKSQINLNRVERKRWLLWREIEKC